MNLVQLSSNNPPPSENYPEKSAKIVLLTMIVVVHLNCSYKI